MMNYGHVNPPLLETLAILSAEPVTLDEAKQHLRETEDVQNTLIAALISAAREHVENITGRALVRARKRMKLWDYVDKLDIRPIPVAQVESYEYLNNQLDPESWTTIDPSIYELQTSDQCATIYLRTDEEWPDGQSDENYPVRVTYIVGPQTLGSPDVPQIPAALKHAILLLVGDMYENREAQMVNATIAQNHTLNRLITPYKLWSP